MNARPGYEGEQKDPVLAYGSCYLITYDQETETLRVLGRFDKIVSNGDLLFDILAVKPWHGASLTQKLRVSGRERRLNTRNIVPVNTEDLPQYLDMPYIAPAFDRALKGETIP